MVSLALQVSQTTTLQLPGSLLASPQQAASGPAAVTVFAITTKLCSSSCSGAGMATGGIARPHRPGISLNRRDRVTHTFMAAASSPSGETCTSWQKLATEWLINWLGATAIHLRIMLTLRTVRRQASASWDLFALNLRAHDRI